MNPTRTIFFVAIVAFVGGFWTACSIGFDPSGSDLQFSCTNDSDCIAPKTCKGGVCASGGTDRCEDADGDGFGAEGTDTTGCSKCVEQGLCDEDCNDNDEAVAPDLLDTCDGKDNDCDGETDEPLSCEDSFDCPAESGTLPACEGSMCVYKPTNQLGSCAGVTLACLGEEGREDPPAECQ